jgi:hypothetical protein
MNLHAARPRGIFLKMILRLWVVIPAEAGIQANKKYWIPPDQVRGRLNQVRNDGTKVTLWQDH